MATQTNLSTGSGSDERVTRSDRTEVKEELEHRTTESSVATLDHQAVMPLIDDKMLSAAAANFASMDKNDDGLLSIDEFRSGLGLLGMDKDFSSLIFNAFDRSGDGFIDRREFIANMVVMLHPEPNELQLSLAFDTCDVNKDGKLDIDEVSNMVASIFAAMARMGHPDARAKYTPENAARSAKELVKWMDRDGDGYVTRDEYIQLARERPDIIKQVGLGGGVRKSQSQRNPTAHQVQAMSEASSNAHKQKQGTVITFGHANWELVVQMMLGIRMALGMGVATSEQRASHASGTSKAEATDTDNPAFNKFLIPSHKDDKARIVFKDYSPDIFKRIRKLFDIIEKDYALSLGPEQILSELMVGALGSLSELFSEGKSGSFFYYSNDARYLIKTIPHREALSLKKVLPSYLEHIELYPQTLLPRYLGFHRIGINGRKVHFVVMANVFSTNRTIHERYDLKGSTFGRTAAKVLADNPGAVRKDLDLCKRFTLGEERRRAMIDQARADLELLSSLNLMDYSLLCGISYPKRDHHPEDAPAEALSMTPNTANAPATAAATADPDAGPTSRSLPKCASEHAPEEAAHGSNRSHTANPRLSHEFNISCDSSSSMPFTCDGTEKRSIPPWVDEPDGAIHANTVGQDPEIYFIGIIDILTAFSFAKLAESVGRSVLHPHLRRGISCKPPYEYASRFAKAMQQWIA